MNNPADTLTALAPCPFCGGAGSMYEPTCNKATPYHSGDRAFPIVRCECGAQIGGDNWDQSGHSAIAAWNRRASLKGEGEAVAITLHDAGQPDGPMFHLPDWERLRNLPRGSTIYAGSPPSEDVVRWRHHDGRQIGPREYKEMSDSGVDLAGFRPLIYGDTAPPAPQAVGEAVPILKPLEWDDHGDEWMCEKGFHIEDLGENPDQWDDKRFRAVWGEGEPECFDTLEEAKADCARQWAEFVGGQIYRPTPSPAPQGGGEDTPLQKAYSDACDAIDEMHELSGTLAERITEVIRQRNHYRALSTPPAQQPGEVGEAAIDQRSAWHKRYIAQMIARGVPADFAVATCEAGYDDHQYEDSPEDAADNEISYMDDDDEPEDAP